MLSKTSTLTLAAALILAQSAMAAAVKPGDLITPEKADLVADLVSPGNLVLVRQGMHMKIVPTGTLIWPPPYKTATEKYSGQVILRPDGTLAGYVAGQPFPLLDPNDSRIAAKVMWNFSFRPLYNDDIDARYVEVASYNPGGSSTDPVGYFTVGHFAFRTNIGRIEVPPIPADPDFARTGIRYRFAFYPVMEPATARDYGLVRYRHMDPNIEDNSWVYNPRSRRVRRQSPTALSDALGVLGGFGGIAGAQGTSSGGGNAEVNNIDPDTYFGFAAKIQNFTYKFLGEKEMLASVHARYSPARPCPFDNGRTICPEDWELRRLYVLEANVKPSIDLTIPKRVLYIDSEGWFITASDQYDRDGQLWKTLALFHTYRDRPVPDARVAIYPYKRMFQTAMVDENVVSGTSSVVYMPGRHTPERETWYIDMGAVENSFFNPRTMANARP